MQEPKLELKKTNRQISRLEIVKARAASRVKQRIIQIQEEERLQQIERELVEKVERGEELRAVTPDETTTKKGDK